MSQTHAPATVRQSVQAAADAITRAQGQILFAENCRTRAEAEEREVEQAKERALDAANRAAQIVSEFKVENAADMPLKKLCVERMKTVMENLDALLGRSPEPATQEESEEAAAE